MYGKSVEFYDVKAGGTHNYLYHCALKSFKRIYARSVLAAKNPNISTFYWLSCHVRKVICTWLSLQLRLLAYKT
jgi:hypothetical protein